MLSLLLAAAAVSTAAQAGAQGGAQGSSARNAVGAEIAFARDARRLGQWTAFRKYADLDAVIQPAGRLGARVPPGRKPAGFGRWWPRKAMSVRWRPRREPGPSMAGTNSPGLHTVWQPSGDAGVGL